MNDFMVILNNRYGKEFSLEKISETQYELKGDFLFLSVITEADKIISVDPEGGPVISVGDKIEDSLVSEICEIDNKIIISVSK